MVGLIYAIDAENSKFTKLCPSHKLTACASASQSAPNRLGIPRMKAASQKPREHAELEKQTVARNIPSKPSENVGGATEKVVSESAGDQQQPPPRLPNSLIDSSTFKSFCRRVEHTVEYLRPFIRSEELSIPQEIVRLNDKINTAALHLRRFEACYCPETVWEDAEYFLKLLEDTLTAVKAATAELKHYIPAKPFDSHAISSSLESLDSVTSEQEVGAHTLKVGVQTGYEVVQERFNDYVKLVKNGLHGEPIEIECSTLKGINSALQMISLLNIIVEFETLSHGLDKKQFTLMIDQKLLKERQQGIIEMFLALCKHLMFLHETLFLMEHLFVKGSPSIKKLASMAAMMKKCWREAFVVMDRMTQTCPMFTEVAHEYYGRLLWHAASLTASMQDVNDLQAFLENRRPIDYDAEVVRDMIKSQTWLLSCLEQLLKLTSRLTRRLKTKSSAKTVPIVKPSALLQDLKKVMYDLAMTTIGRSSWLNSYADQSSMTMLNDLRDQGARTISFVFDYNKSHISIQCDKESTVEDVSLYSGMVCATNVLRNGVLQLLSLIQRPSSISEESEELSIADDATEEDSGTIKFHRIAGIRRLQTKISIKPYPLSLEGSTEFDLSSYESESKLVSQLGRTSLKSPWEIEEEPESTPQSPFDRRPPDTSEPKRRTSSVDSIELITGFRDVEGSGEVDSDVMLEKSSLRGPVRDFSLILPTKSPSHTDRSPFESQQPPEPPSTVSGWESAPLETTNETIPSVVSSDRVKDVLAVDLIPGPIIGKGSEGHVLKMSYHTTPVAVKIMNHTSLRTRERFKQETKILSKLSPHENIVNFVGRCKDLKASEENTADLVMVMEYCELGNLYKIISEANYIRELQAIGKDLTQFKEEFGYLLYSDWGRRLQVACDIAAGAAHMHQNNVVHRDLTSFNVVLKKGEDGAWISKICDFERSRHVPPNENIPRSSALANSPAWSAPEVLREDPYSVQADVFSLGVILWELWTLEEPWKYDERDVRNPMMIIPMVGNGERLKIPSTVDARLPHLHDLRALIEACWNEDPSQRPTMHQAHEKLLEMKDKLAH